MVAQEKGKITTFEEVKAAQEKLLAKFREINQDNIALTLDTVYAGKNEDAITILSNDDEADLLNFVGVPLTKELARDKLYYYSHYHKYEDYYNLK